MGKFSTFLDSVQIADRLFEKPDRREKDAVSKGCSYLFKTGRLIRNGNGYKIRPAATAAEPAKPANNGQVQSAHIGHDTHITPSGSRTLTVKGRDDG